MTPVDTYEIIEFEGVSGILLAPESGGHGFVAVRHSADEPSWSDSGTHVHARSDEIYLLLKGRLDLIVAGGSISLSPGEMLLVRAGIPHGVVGGAGPIEHIGFRAPALDDRDTGPTLPGSVPLQPGEWGHHISLREPEARNCWLLGVGAARFHSPHLLLAYLDFPMQAEAVAGLGTRLQMHAHRASWEHYLCLRGSKTLIVEGDIVEIHPGQMLVVAPGARHNVIDRRAPYAGFTFRAPILDDKVPG